MVVTDENRDTLDPDEFDDSSDSESDDSAAELNRQIESRFDNMTVGRYWRGDGSPPKPPNGTKWKWHESQQAFRLVPSWVPDLRDCPSPEPDYLRDTPGASSSTQPPVPVTVENSQNESSDESNNEPNHTRDDGSSQSTSDYSDENDEPRPRLILERRLGLVQAADGSGRWIRAQT